MRIMLFLDYMNSRMGGYSIYDNLLYQAENVLQNFYNVFLQMYTINKWAIHKVDSSK